MSDSGGRSRGEREAAPAPVPRPSPRRDDPDTGGYWEAVQQGQLAVCACDACGAVVHLPRAFCDRCHRAPTRWRPVRPEGTLYSWTRAEHQVHPAFPVPYTVVLVELADATEARVVGYLPGTADLAIGMALQATFEPLEDGTLVPVWAPAPGR